MRLVVIAVGKVKERGLREVIDDYLARIRKYVPCDELELRDGKNVEASLRGAIPPSAHVVALEVRGKAMTSEQLARFVAARGRESKGVVAFLIGGADGLPASLSREADTQLSLSSLTLAHRVARVVLAEQLYRAVSIWKGTPYHRA
ncbi:MAG: 23S rRNA (pseudouridine(1915)-N(3))-methyltransferase RlmH [Myxococcota bacterium]